MDLHEALSTRRTVHRYRPDPVPDEAIERALAQAHLAPNHRLTWPWRFVLMGRGVREQLIPTAVRLKCKDRPPTELLEQKIRNKLLAPPVVIAVSCLRSDDPLRHQEDLAAVACAIQNLCLSLHADGIASKWGSGAITRADESYALLGIDRSEATIVGFIQVGYADGTPTTPTRPPLEPLVRRIP